MDKYPLFKNWVTEVEQLNYKMHDNPYGPIEIGIEINGVKIGVSAKAISLKLGHNSPMMKFQEESAWANLNRFRHEYTILKKELNILLETAKVRVDENIKNTDHVLFAMAQKHIPEMVIKRMRGETISFSNKEIMLQAAEFHLEQLVSEINVKIGTIKRIELEKILKVKFTEEVEWTISLEIARDENARIFIGKHLVVKDSVGVVTCRPDNSSVNVMIFLLYIEEISKIVNSMIFYLQKINEI